MPRIPRQVREIGKGLLFRMYVAGLRTGLAILPNHYYVGAPDVRALAMSKDQWARRSSLRGLPMDPDRQLATMREMCAPFVDESIGNPHFKQATERRFGPGFGYIEARALHGVIRSLKPRRVIEVGSGVSTYCMQQASALNANDCKLTCIEPHPSDWLKTANVTLLAAPVQSIPREVFETLGAGDFLFIDSSHAVKTGGDVNYLILEILPMLRPGVNRSFSRYHLAVRL